MIDTTTSSIRVALAHDWLVGLRGGEWVLDRLARQFGPTDLYTLVDDGRPLTPAISACRVTTSPLQRLPRAAGAWRRHYLPLYAWAVERLRVTPCDVLVSTSSAVMKSIRPPEGTPHLCYCHSPARYLWEQTADYTHGTGGRLRGLALRAIGGRFRRWDRRTAGRVTTFIANSRHTADRIRRCFDRDAEVIHPPVRTDFYTPDPAVTRADHYLLVSALEPYKRVDMAIDVANRRQIPLIVVGSGSQLETLRAQAGPTVELLGRVDDDRLRELYRSARALLHPQQEDFGIIAVEAQAAGCPVIAYGVGGATETVVDGTTGVWFDEQSSAGLTDAIIRFETLAIESQACRANAERFAPDVFDTAMRRMVEHAVT